MVSWYHDMAGWVGIVYHLYVFKIMGGRGAGKYAIGPAGWRAAASVRSPQAGHRLGPGPAWRGAAARRGGRGGFKAWALTGLMGVSGDDAAWEARMRRSNAQGEGLLGHHHRHDGSPASHPWHLRSSYVWLDGGLGSVGVDKRRGRGACHGPGGRHE